MIRLLLVGFFLEIGFVLVVVPWSAYWDRNYFAQVLPHVHLLITNNFIRGAISGLGLVNVAAGVVELVALLLSRPLEEPVLHIAPPRASED